MTEISHFAALLLFALLCSIIFGCLTQRTTLGRFKYAALSFVLFVMVSVGIAWLMYPFSK